MKCRKIELNELERDCLKNKLLTRSKFNENSSCLEWQYGKAARGYGSVYFKRKVFLTHRASWMAFKGDIPDGLMVCHRCDNTSCINIDHLFLGTQSQNMDDMISKGRWKKGIRRKKITTDTDDKKQRRQIVFDVHPEFHKKVKILAAKRNVSMSLWINRAIIDYIAKETKYDDKPKE